MDFQSQDSTAPRPSCQSQRTLYVTREEWSFERPRVPVETRELDRGRDHLLNGFFVGLRFCFSKMRRCATGRGNCSKESIQIKMESLADPSCRPRDRKRRDTTVTWKSETSHNAEVCISMLVRFDTLPTIFFDVGSLKTSEIQCGSGGFAAKAGGVLKHLRVGWDPPYFRLWRKRIHRSLHNWTWNILKPQVANHRYP